MKTKALILLVVMIMAIFLVACDGGEGGVVQPGQPVIVTATIDPWSSLPPDQRATAKAFLGDWEATRVSKRATLSAIQTPRP